MLTVFTLNAGKAVMQDAAIKVAVYDLFHVGPEKAVLFGKTIVVNLFQRFKMVFNSARGGIVLRFPGFARAIYRRDIGHDRFSFGSQCRMPDEIYCRLN